MNDLDPDQVSRTSLLFMREAGDATLGTERHQDFTVNIIAAAETCAERQGQAAIVTAVKTAVRAQISERDGRRTRITVMLGDPNQKVVGGPCTGETLGEVVALEGARVVGALERLLEAPTILIGRPPAGTSSQPTWTLATWSGWTAETSRGISADKDFMATGGNVLAAMAAAAMAVADAFLLFARPNPADFGHRTFRLDLWSPSPDEGRHQAPPPLRYAPSKWWLLGLGHLGQAYAHVISWLDYEAPNEVEVVLQDVQRTVPANHSTGLLTPPGSDGVRKTRLVAEVLDRCGLTTSIVERFMTQPTAVRSEDMHVALVGVDNLPTRRLIDSFGWKTTIDVGLGVGIDDFDGITLLRFPGRSSQDVPAWQEPETTPAAGDDHAIAADLDPCGIVRLNGVAVGASFVGAVAAVLAVAEALRPLHQGCARSVVCLNIGEKESEAASSLLDVTPPVAAELRI